MYNGCDCRRLVEAIKRSGLKREYIAKELGISPASLTNKTHGYRPFKLSEVQALKRILSLDDSEAIAIFFDNDVRCE